MLKKKKSKSWILPALIIFIMVFSGLGYFAGDKGGKYDYNGYEFIQGQDAWLLEEYNLILRYHPEEIVYIDSPEITLDQDVYLTFDPEIPGLDYVDLIRLDLTEFLSDKTVYAGISKPANQSLPVINCGDFNGTFIDITVGDNSIITKEDNCYTIQADSTYGLAAVSERFKLTYLGVMNATS